MVAKLSNSLYLHTKDTWFSERGGVEKYRFCMHKWSFNKHGWTKSKTIVIMCTSTANQNAILKIEIMFTLKTVSHGSNSIFKLGKNITPHFFEGWSNLETIFNPYTVIPLQRSTSSITSHMSFFFLNQTNVSLRVSAHQQFSVVIERTLKM